MPRVFDYDKFKDADYHHDFWEGKGREYEDSCERTAIAELLPQKGQWFIDVGAGFGRLTPLYLKKYQRIVLFDYSASLLAEARASISAENVYFVLGDLYCLPFAPHVFDASLMVRVLHHVEDVPGALQEIKRILKKEAAFIFEYPNKRNLLEILRYLGKRKHIEPFKKAPTSRQELYYNFHPEFIEEVLEKNGFEILTELSVSNFRADLLKKVLGAKFLSFVDGLLQKPLGYIKLSPSVFVRARAQKDQGPETGDQRPNFESILYCPACREKLVNLTCDQCKAKYSIKDGIYDLRPK